MITLIASMAAACAPLSIPLDSSRMDIVETMNNHNYQNSIERNGTEILAFSDTGSTHSFILKDGKYQVHMFRTRVSEKDESDVIKLHKMRDVLASIEVRECKSRLTFSSFPLSQDRTGYIAMRPDGTWRVYMISKVSGFYEFEAIYGRKEDINKFIIVAGEETR